ncbi:hypothetical protein PYW07_013470 [Mythimna separata]|uniref:Uncharacterized protein n=1 Tax=Mythimna separata TaxID=271217 RepID=A0AAD7Y6C0_MYTSE|nr:hypothetical protein PYW07_013470 [Mythimna separata]
MCTPEAWRGGVARSPSHESVTTDLSLFSVSSAASDARVLRLLACKVPHEAWRGGVARSPSHESVTTDLSLFSVSSAASDARVLRLLACKVPHEAWRGGVARSPSHESVTTDLSLFSVSSAASDARVLRLLACKVPHEAWRGGVARSPSHESVTTDLSLFSVSSAASDARVLRLLACGTGPRPFTPSGQPEPRQQSAKEAVIIIAAAAGDGQLPRAAGGLRGAVRTAGAAALLQRGRRGALPRLLPAAPQVLPHQEPTSSSLPLQATDNCRELLAGCAALCAQLGLRRSFSAADVAHCRDSCQPLRRYYLTRSPHHHHCRCRRRTTAASCWRAARRCAHSWGCGAPSARPTWRTAATPASRSAGTTSPGAHIIIAAAAGDGQLPRAAGGLRGAVRTAGAAALLQRGRRGALPRLLPAAPQVLPHQEPTSSSLPLQATDNCRELLAGCAALCAQLGLRRSFSAADVAHCRDSCQPLRRYYLTRSPHHHHCRCRRRTTAASCWRAARRCAHSWGCGAPSARPTWRTAATPASRSAGTTSPGAHIIITAAAGDGQLPRAAGGLRGAVRTAGAAALLQRGRRGALPRLLPAAPQVLPHQEPTSSSLPLQATDNCRELLAGCAALCAQLGLRRSFSAADVAHCRDSCQPLRRYYLTRSPHHHHCRCRRRTTAASCWRAARRCAHSWGCGAPSARPTWRTAATPASRSAGTTSPGAHIIITAAAGDGQLPRAAGGLRGAVRTAGAAALLQRGRRGALPRLLPAAPQVLPHQEPTSSSLPLQATDNCRELLAGCAALCAQLGLRRSFSAADVAHCRDSCQPLRRYYLTRSPHHHHCRCRRRTTAASCWRAARRCAHSWGCGAPSARPTWRTAATPASRSAGTTSPGAHIIITAAAGDGQLPRAAGGLRGAVRTAGAAALLQRGRRGALPRLLPAAPQVLPHQEPTSSSLPLQATDNCRELLAGCAALCAQLGLRRSFSAADVAHCRDSCQPLRSATSEVGLCAALEALTLSAASRSCSTWVAVGGSQLPSPQRAQPAQPPPRQLPTDNKKVRQSYIKRRLLTTYRALERMSQSDFNLDRLEAAAVCAVASAVSGAGPTTLAVPSAKPTHARIVHPEAAHLALTAADLERERGRPLSKYERNMMIFNWLHTLDDAAPF